MNKCIFSIFISTLVFFLIACQNTHNLEAEKIIANNELPMEQTEKLFLNKAQKYFAEKRAKQFKDSTENLSYYTLKPKDIIKLTFSRLPYYQLDTSFIRHAPTIDNLLKHIHAKTKTPLYIGKLHDQYAIVMNLCPAKEPPGYRNSSWKAPSISRKCSNGCPRHWRMPAPKNSMYWNQWAYII